MTQRLFDAAARMSSRGQGVGPLDGWTRVRETTIALMIQQGLQSDHTVVDLGCGHLRVGSFLIDFLQADRYLGIEPRIEIVEEAIKEMQLADLVETKRPRFSDRTDFNVAGFDAAVDMVVARSIWSHATRDQIRATLDAFVECANPGAVLLASWYEPVLRMPRFWPYYGKKWCYPGQTKRGASAHFAGFIRREARARGLSFATRRTSVPQTWAVIRAPGGQEEDRVGRDRTARPTPAEDPT